MWPTKGMQSLLPTLNFTLVWPTEVELIKHFFVMLIKFNLLAMASNLLAMASNLLEMSSNLLAMASNLLAMAPTC